MPLLNEVDRSILRTIIYFDLFDFPLTSWEIYKYLLNSQKTSYQSVCNSLHNIKHLVNQDQGFYFLKNRAEIINNRKKNYLLAEKKNIITLKNARLLTKLPFIKAIYICNNLAYANSSENSDIDFFIITDKNKIWTARFFGALLMKILKRRPQKNSTKDKICLSFFCAEDNLNFQKITYPNDIYFYYWLAQLKPVYDPHNLQEKIFEKNQWLKKILPNFLMTKTDQQNLLLNQSILQKIFELILPAFTEKLFFKIQMKNLPQKIKIKSKDKNTNVIINEKIIKLHVNDRRKHYRDQWLDKCQTTIPNFQLKDLVDLIKNKNAQI